VAARIRRFFSGRRRLLLAFCVLLLIGGAGGLFWKPAGNAPGAADAARRRDMAFPVTAAPAHAGDIEVYVEGLGNVTPRNLVTVKSRVDGQLMRLAFTEGQMVRRGELLAEIDPRPFEVQLAQAEGQLLRDEALLKNAQLDLNRYRTLLAQDSIAKQQFDTQEALVRQYEGAVKVDRGQVDSARLQLSYARITAPVSGRVGLRQVDPGNMIHASDSNGLVVLAQLQPITVVFSLPEDAVQRIMPRLSAGESLPVLAYDREKRNLLATGTLLTVDNQIDPATGTFKLKAEFANDDNRLFPNQFVNARMRLETRRQVLLVPSAAIQRGSQGTFVYVVKDDHTVSVRPVQTGPSQGEETLVEHGLASGERVVTDGVDKLREGARVQLVTPSGKAEAGKKPGVAAAPPAQATQADTAGASPPAGRQVVPAR
jgi:multidrug efflux system membrane fusion protein